MEVSSLDNHITLLQQFAWKGTFTEEVERAAQKTARLICSQGIKRENVQVTPTAYGLGLTKLEPILRTSIERELYKQKNDCNDPALTILDELMTVVKVAAAAVTIYSSWESLPNLEKALDELEKQIFNHEYISESHTYPPKRILLQSTGPLGEALKGWQKKCQQPLLLSRIGFMRSLIAALTVSTEIFIQPGYYSAALIMRIHYALPHEKLCGDLLEKFAVDALLGQTGKFIIFQANIRCENGALDQLVVMFSDKTHRIISFEKGEWRFKKESFASLSLCLDRIAHGHTPAVLPYPQPGTVRIPSSWGCTWGLK